MAFKLRKTFNSAPVQNKTSDMVQTFQNEEISDTVQTFKNEEISDTVQTFQNEEKKKENDISFKNPPNYPEREHFVYDKRDKKWKIVKESEMYKYS
jgi:hypothetical protein